MRKALESEKLLIHKKDQPPTKRLKNIHEVMYNIATDFQSWVVIPKIQSGPGGWSQVQVTRQIFYL